jgi:hypothetical protein
MSKKETFKEAGYKYIKYLGDGEHLLINDNGVREVFITNKNHANWGLKYKNTHLEFVRQLYNDEATFRTN